MEHPPLRLRPWLRQLLKMFIWENELDMELKRVRTRGMLQVLLLISSSDFDLPRAVTTYSLFTFQICASAYFCQLFPRTIHNRGILGAIVPVLAS